LIRLLQKREKTKRNAKAGEIIRALIGLFQKFNQKYNKGKKGEEGIEGEKPLKLWINFLFLDTPGFSLENIQKAPQR
jgi:hypothetical protein